MMYDIPVNKGGIDMAEKVLSARIDEDLMKALKMIVVSKGQTMQDVVAEIVEKYVRENKD